MKKAKVYYKNNKEVLKGNAKNKYEELSEEDKNIKKQYRRKRYHNMSKNDKEKLKKYQKHYREAKKKL